MNTRKAILLGFSVVLVGVLAVQAWRWRQPLDPRGPLGEMLDQAQSEVQQFEEAGGKPGAPDHPGRKWAEIFWKYRDEHPRTLEGKTAGVLGIQYFVEAGSWDEVLARIKSFAPDDPVRLSYFWALYEKAGSERLWPAFITYAQGLRKEANGDRPQDQAMRARLDYHIGRAYDALRNPVEARASFDRAIQEAPASTWARVAQLGIYELEHLSAGQPAPQFAGTGLDGKPLALANLRGRTVLLDFWGKG